MQQVTVAQLAAHYKAIFTPEQLRTRLASEVAAQQRHITHVVGLANPSKLAQATAAEHQLEVNALRVALGL